MPPTKRHKNFATWAGAVKEWNKHQEFRNDLYGIPKKGGAFYDQVFELFYGKPSISTPVLSPEEIAQEKEEADFAKRLKRVTDLFSPSKFNL